MRFAHIHTFVHRVWTQLRQIIEDFSETRAPVKRNRWHISCAKFHYNRNEFEFGICLHLFVWFALLTSMVSLFWLGAFFPPKKVQCVFYFFFICVSLFHCVRSSSEYSSFPLTTYVFRLLRRLEIMSSCWWFWLVFFLFGLKMKRQSEPSY